MANLTVLDGSSFFVSDAAGDVDITEAMSSNVMGLFHSDVRHLAVWSLLIDGQPMRVLTSRPNDYYSARMFGALAAGRHDPSIAVRRERIVADGVHEDLWVSNNSGEPVTVCVELRFGADFADLLAVKRGESMRGRTSVEVDGPRVTLRYQNQAYERLTTIRFGEPGELHEDLMRWNLTIAPREEWTTCIDIGVVVDGKEVSIRTEHGGMGTVHPNMEMSLGDWMDTAPTLHTDVEPFQRTYQQSLLNLAALRFRPHPNGMSLPAAGLPWFMALFGRDSLIAAYQALPFHPSLAESALRTLAELQATEYDDFRDAEPGKIPHELRSGESSHLGVAPYTPYYGSHDSTPLFLILLDEYERWTGNVALVRELEQAARNALGWIEGPGDRDGDGYLEYETRSSAGLRSQCWKDSWNSVMFADGRVADPPIATCEIQGYAYDARLRTARLAREIWGDASTAERLERDAAALRERFNRDFWIEDRGHYALALDGAKNQVDACTSNFGHLLWSGILDDERAELVVRRLLADDMWSGWGIRTMSTKDDGYNPIEYHNGTVWPHDNSIIAEGMRRYGFKDEASKVIHALLEAGRDFEFLLPEVFAGHPRSETGTPVEYPTACRPQAWAAGAPLLGLRTVLGMDAGKDGLTVNPHVPAAMGRIRLDGVPVRGQRRNVS
ncbi:amylo-alpha-1,6-glucosidase [Rugosimonospora africana]|uniref:Amylo-alpha-1,6-glucosidase n=1 Tax=Rugosimonospora africana TaxID=556532 RepID=A0A8J3VTS9_9ACTN|nr:amylo-alpha-1,6-glucosidase [Rugosimonospora africana]GIH18011.1 amylo-alpha-1,6-glucosidase [Rugosimonospora africana]